jgi:hypothetical protein
MPLEVTLMHEFVLLPDPASEDLPYTNRLIVHKS